MCFVAPLFQNNLDSILDQKFTRQGIKKTLIKEAFIVVVFEQCKVSLGLPSCVLKHEMFEVEEGVLWLVVLVLVGDIRKSLLDLGANLSSD